MTRMPRHFLALGAVPHPSEPAIHDKLRDILSRREFTGEGRDRNWLEKLLRAVGEVLVRLFEWLGTLREVAPLLFWLLLIACVVLLLLLGGWVVRRARRMLFVGEGEAAAEEAARRGRLSAECREEALERARRGEFTEAIRFLFLSLVYRFDESGRVLFRRSQTNHEYLGLFDEQPRVHEGLGVFVDTLDDHWYGLRPAGREQYERCLALYDSLIQGR